MQLQLGGVIFDIYSELLLVAATVSTPRLEACLILTILLAAIILLFMSSSFVDYSMVSSIALRMHFLFSKVTLNFFVSLVDPVNSSRISLTLSIILLT